MKVVHNNSETTKLTETTAAEKSLYEVLEKLPTPKKEFNLTKDQKKLWYWFGYEFLATRQLTTLDLMHLQNAAVSLDARNKMIAKINELNIKDPDGTAGWVQVFANRTTNVSGYQTMYEKATKQLDEVSAHFGLSFKDRHKLNEKQTSDPNQLSMFEMFYQQKSAL